VKALPVLPSIALAIGAAAAQPAAEFKWDELQRQGRVAAGAVLRPDSGSSGYRLQIENTTPRGSTVTVLTVDRPQISRPRYRLSGLVRYDNVEGVGYLELWNYFPSGAYFSRTLAEQGPMMKLQGSSGWRAFVLPFDATGAPAPTRLVVNVVLQGRGTVYLGPMELSEDQGSTAGQLGDPSIGRAAGLAGSIAGLVIGSAGALIGLLTSLGRARRFVIASATSLIAFGALSFLAGIVAFASGPYSSFYPLLLLLGFLMSVVPLGLLPMIRKRYEEIELRTMRAHDLG
jgi:hypothetical protein